MLRGMLAGIGACHSAGVAHRDIKADNFLVAASSPCMADFTIKLCDFGLAARVNWPEAQDPSASSGGRGCDAVPGRRGHPSRHR